MSSSLPAQPSLRQLKVQAKELHQALAVAQPEAIARFTQATGRAPNPESKLSDAQLVLAREYGFANWAALKEEVERRENQADETLLQQFRHAVRGGDVSALQSLLAEHPVLKRKLNEPLFDFGGSAILNAVGRKDRAMIDALIAAGADLNQKSHWEPGGFGVLDCVDDELGDYLISRGAEVDVHAVAHLGRIDRLCALLDANPALVNARGGDGGTPLHFARNLEVVNLLLQRGADVTIRDRDHGSTAAMWRVKNKDVLYRLIEAGSPIDIFMACVHGDLELAQRALREDPECLSAFISHANGQGKFAADTGGNIYNWEVGQVARPIPTAVTYGHHDLAKYLLTKASRAEQLIAYCLMDDKGAVDQLVHASPGLAASLSENDARALPDAVHFRKRAAAKLMFHAVFPVLAKGIEDFDALHFAAWHGDAELVQLALDKGAFVENRANLRRGTPLEGACHGSLHCWDRQDGDYPAVIALLIRAGANVEKQSELKKSGGKDWASPEVTEAIP